MNEPTTGTELMARWRETHGPTRLDAIVAPLMRYADRYATAHTLAARLGNVHGDEDSMRHWRAVLDEELRAAITKAEHFETILGWVRNQLREAMPEYRDRPVEFLVTEIVRRAVVSDEEKMAGIFRALKDAGIDVLEVKNGH